MRISLETLYFIKNSIVNVINRNIPSDRTIVQHAAKANDNKIHFLSYFRKITNDVILDNMNNGSVIPVVELSMILGSNMNNAEPTSAILSSKNFLHRKKTGIVINTDKTIARLLCNCIYSIVFSKLITENQNDRNNYYSKRK